MIIKTDSEMVDLCGEGASGRPKIRQYGRVDDLNQREFHITRI
jgi:hypothetical protein